MIMRHHSRGRLGVLLFATTAAGAAAAGPALRVDATCATRCVIPGGTVTVPIAFAGDGASVGSIDFTLAHDADLRFTTAALGAALPTTTWIAPLSSPPITPGVLPVQIAPQFKLPAAPDGEIALLTFTTDATAPEGCRGTRTISSTTDAFRSRSSTPRPATSPNGQTSPQRSRRRLQCGVL